MLLGSKQKDMAPDPTTYKAPAIAKRVTETYLGDPKLFLGFHYVTVPQWSFSEGISGFMSGESYKHHFFLSLEQCKRLNEYLWNTDFVEYEDKMLVRDQRRIVLERMIVDLHHNPRATMLYNYASEVLIHDFWWKCLKPRAVLSQHNKISREMKIALNLQFGGYREFLNELRQKALSIKSNGYVWVLADRSKIEIITTHNSQHPITITKKMRPLLVLDMWEHAYCLDYHNDKERYIDNFLEVIHWDFVNQNFSLARRKTD